MYRTLLTARLALRDRPTGEGEPPKDDGRLTESEWQAKREAELAKRSHADLIARQIDLERDLKKARDKAAPEGSRVLTPDEAKEWDAYTALGASKDLKTRLETGEKAVTDLASRQRGDTIREVAELAGYKPSVLGKLADGLSFDIGAEVEQDGKKTRPISVKDASGKATPLAEYAQANWADFMPSLTATGGEGSVTPAAPRVIPPLGGAGAPIVGKASSEQALAEKRQDSRYQI